jgi:hypothetical protein
VLCGSACLGSVEMYWSSVSVRRAALKYLEKTDSESLIQCEEILMIVNVVILRAHDGLGGGDGMSWCLALRRHIDSPIAIMEGLMVLSNKVLRTTQFGLHKAERYLYILASHWAKILALNEEVVPEMVAALQQVMPLKTEQESELEFWTDLLSKGRSGLFQRLIAKMNGRLPEKAKAVPFTSLVSAMDVIIDDISINSIL